MRFGRYFPSTSRLLVWAGTVLLLCLSAEAEAAGPFKVAEGSYQFLGRDEPLVATDRKVDLWAEVYRPATNTGKALPLVIFLHGNHGTCGYFDTDHQVRIDDDATYTATGACPDGYVVTPNHLGYAYLANELASWGYMVVSINANRGITAGWPADGDWGLNLMRGRLVLRHLALLADWNAGQGQISPPASLGFDPRRTMDFSQVGLMGHSRGGEGVRAALQQFRDQGSRFPALISGLNIRSIFEIGPVDGQTSRVLDADGVNSMVLLPACDGDVYDLEGMHVFDRVFLRERVDAQQAFHGTFLVYGADHNAYNTEWQTADSPGCKGSETLFPQYGTSKPQQATAVATLVPFFRATIGANANRSLASFFEPTSPLPTSISSVTTADRGYLPSPIGSNVKLLETFSHQDGTGDSGLPIVAEGVSVAYDEASYEHQWRTRVATVSWTRDAPYNRYVQVDLGAGTDLSSSKALSFRTALRCFGTICNARTSDKGEMSYGIQLIDATGSTSNTFTTTTEVPLHRPTGADSDYVPLHSALLTIDLPLSVFRGVDLSRIKSVRFSFQNQTEGVVDLADLAVLTSLPTPTAPMTVALSGVQPVTNSSTGSIRLAETAAPTAAEDGNTLRVGTAAAGASSAGRPLLAMKVAQPQTVTISLSTKRSFPVTNSLPKLTVGKQTVNGVTTLSPDGKSMTIEIPRESYRQLPAGADVSLKLLASAPAWQFGPLPK